MHYSVVAKVFLLVCLAALSKSVRETSSSADRFGESSSSSRRNYSTTARSESRTSNSPAFSASKTNVELLLDCNLRLEDFNGKVVQEKLLYSEFTKDAFDKNFIPSAYVCYLNNYAAGFIYCEEDLNYPKDIIIVEVSLSKHFKSLFQNGPVILKLLFNIFRSKGKEFVFAKAFDKTIEDFYSRLGFLKGKPTWTDVANLMLDLRKYPISHLDLQPVNSKNLQIREVAKKNKIELDDSIPVLGVYTSSKFMVGCIFFEDLHNSNDVLINWVHLDEPYHLLQDGPAVVTKFFNRLRDDKDKVFAKTPFSHFLENLYLALGFSYVGFERTIFSLKNRPNDLFCKLESVNIDRSTMKKLDVKIRMVKNDKESAMIENIFGPTSDEDEDINHPLNYYAYFCYSPIIDRKETTKILATVVCETDPNKETVRIKHFSFKNSNELIQHGSTVLTQLMSKQIVEGKKTVVVEINKTNNDEFYRNFGFKGEPYRNNPVDIIYDLTEIHPTTFLWEECHLKPTELSDLDIKRKISWFNSRQAFASSCISKENKIVGFVAFEMTDDKKYVDIKFVSIKNGCRMVYQGSTIIKKLLKEWKNQGVKDVSTSVDRYNLYVFYSTLGFVGDCPSKNQTCRMILNISHTRALETDMDIDDANDLPETAMVLHKQEKTTLQCRLYVADLTNPQLEEWTNLYINNLKNQYNLLAFSCDNDYGNMQAVIFCYYSEENEQDIHIILVSIDDKNLIAQLLDILVQQNKERVFVEVYDKNFGAIYHQLGFTFGLMRADQISTMSYSLMNRQLINQIIWGRQTSSHTASSSQKQCELTILRVKEVLQNPTYFPHNQIKVMIDVHKIKIPDVNATVEYFTAACYFTFANPQQKKLCGFILYSKSKRSSQVYINKVVIEELNDFISHASQIVIQLTEKLRYEGKKVVRAMVYNSYMQKFYRQLGFQGKKLLPSEMIYYLFKIQHFDDVTPANHLEEGEIKKKDEKDEIVEKILEFQQTHNTPGQHTFSKASLAAGQKIVCYQPYNLAIVGYILYKPANDTSIVELVHLEVDGENIAKGVDSQLMEYFLRKLDVERKGKLQINYSLVQAFESIISLLQKCKFVLVKSLFAMRIELEGDAIPMKKYCDH